jgi:alpha-ketoglutarate-dependent taurine dioxygenase
MPVDTNFKVEPLETTFGAVLTGLKLAQLDDETFSRLYETWLEYALLIFPDQHLSVEEQQVFAERFGKLEFAVGPISNVKSDGTVRGENMDDDVVKILKGNMGWHADSTYMPVQAKGAVFSAHVVPPAGGETGWADMRAAYDALDDDTRECIADLSAYHSLYYSQSKLGHTPGERSEYSGYGFHNQDPPLRPLVKPHPETGRLTLLIGRHAYGIPGMDPDESERFLEELTEFACRPPRTYHHNWTEGDAVVWDNRCLLHQACPWDMNEPRVMYNARIAGDPKTEHAAHASKEKDERQDLTTTITDPNH